MSMTLTEAKTEAKGLLDKAAEIENRYEGLIENGDDEREVKRLLSEFNTYYRENRAAVDAAILASNSAQVREDIAKMEQEIEETETKLATLRAKLAGLVA